MPAHCFAAQLLSLKLQTTCVLYHSSRALYLKHFLISQSPLFYSQFFSFASTVISIKVCVNRNALSLGLLQATRFWLLTKTRSSTSYFVTSFILFSFFIFCTYLPPNPSFLPPGPPTHINPSICYFAHISMHKHLYAHTSCHTVASHEQAQIFT